MRNTVLGFVKLFVLLSSLLVSAHLVWKFSTQSISEQRQEFLRFESDLYRTKENRALAASRHANFTLSHVSSSSRVILPDMNSFASNIQSVSGTARPDGIDDLRKAHEASMFMVKPDKSNHFHSMMYP